MDPSIAAAALIDSMDIDSMDHASLDRFPDEIVYEILNKGVELKTLCICKCVNTRLLSNAVKVDKVSFTTPVVNPYYHRADEVKYIEFYHNSGRNRYPCQSPYFVRAMKSLSTFRSIKSLHIQLPYTPLDLEGVVDRTCFKWRLRFGKNSSNNKISPFIFILSTTGFADSNGVGLEDEEALFTDNYINPACVLDSIVRYRMLLSFIQDHPDLEKISITDTLKKGRVSLSDASKIKQLRDGLMDGLGDSHMNITSSFFAVSLNLQDSGYTMGPVKLLVVQNKDADLEANDFEDEFEDELEAVYKEAIMLLLKDHRDSLERTTIP